MVWGNLCWFTSDLHHPSSSSLHWMSRCSSWWSWGKDLRLLHSSIVIVTSDLRSPIHPGSAASLSQKLRVSDRREERRLKPPGKNSKGQLTTINLLRLVRFPNHSGRCFRPSHLLRVSDWSEESFWMLSGKACIPWQLTIAKLWIPRRWRSNFQPLGGTLHSNTCSIVFARSPPLFVS